MPINHEVKGSLARLLATENLIVEHKKVSTASFDVLNRVLVLPLWERASATVYDMLVGHEVGHALYTPSDEWDFLGEIPKDYVNVIEDARIEKLMKRKYPGLAKSFYKGYNELNDDDFFSIQDEDLDTFSLIDRINLHFKIGAYARVPFNEQEYQFVEMTEKAETFDDVLNICRKLVEYIKEHKKDSAQLETPETPQGGSGTAQGESEEQYQVGDQSQSNGSSTESDESDHGSDDSSYGGTAGGSTNEEISKTQRSFDEELKELNGGTFGHETKYVEVPNVHIDDVIIGYEDLHKHINSCWNEQLAQRDPKYWNNCFDVVDALYRQYKTSAQKEVNYLVKEFECKKSADSYARSSTSRTGVLDMSKLHTFKYNEDLFRKVSVIPDGKNHGLIFILDWSGSMGDYLLDTVKQLFNLVWFCKKVQIPFEVYAFTYDFSDFITKPDLEETPKKYEAKNGTISIHKYFHLLNFFSSKCNSRELENHLQNIWRLAYRHDRGGTQASYSIPVGLELSGTPLNESIICLHKIIPQFKNQNKLQKVNVVLLTDGEANGMTFDIQLDVTNPYLGQNRCGHQTALRDRKTGHVYRNFNWDNQKDCMTTILLENIKHNFPEVNLIGFRILSGYEFNTFCRRNLFYEDAKCVKVLEKWKKEKSTEFNGFGYDALYAISSTNLSKDSEFEVDEEASNAQIGKAFRKMLKNKGTNKKILSSFASFVA
ncbi:peptidase [Synechococcus phage DSL-LC02]|nr:peptidase [Synechococcus phage DSL-LC02]